MISVAKGLALMAVGFFVHACDSAMRGYIERSDRYVAEVKWLLRFSKYACTLAAVLFGISKLM